MQRGDKLPFENRSVALIYIENAPDSQHIRKELLRVLAKGGTISVWNGQEYIDSLVKNIKEQNPNIKVEQHKEAMKFSGDRTYDGIRCIITVP